ncbi:uncharacterized protein UHOD_02139 [Ustilago sp. UG-2017b]|nr:uncharacterized protein UHOD_02139 [Ustilago sp. UG-2017b]
MKCDGNDPCSACQGRLIECVDVQGKKRGPPSKLEQRQKSTSTSIVRGASSTTPSSSSSSSSDNASNDGAEQHPRPMVKRARVELATLAHQSRASSPRQHPSGFVGYAWSALAPSNQGADSTCTSISPQKLQSLLALTSQAPTTSTLPNVGCSGMSDGSSQIELKNTSNSSCESAISELSDEVIDQLLTVYQSFVHLHWPIIYLPSLSSLRVLADTHPLLYHAVLAVAAGTHDTLNPNASTSLASTSAHDSASTSPQTSSQHARSPTVCPPGTASRLVGYLKQHIKSQDLAKTLETIQVLILLALVEMGGGDTSDAHVHSSMACVLAIDLGLHRSQSSVVSAQLYRAEEKQRFLWGCYALDKVLAAALERPAMLRSDDIDIDLPSTQERDEYDIFVNDRSRHFVASHRISIMTDVKCRCISSFNAYCSLMMLLERILDRVYSPKARQERKRGHFGNYKQSVIKLDAALRLWRKELPHHIQWRCDNDSELLSPPTLTAQTRIRNDNVPPQVLTVRAWYSACMLLLHRPRLPLDIGSSVSRRRIDLDNVPADSGGAGKEAMLSDTFDASEERQTCAASNVDTIPHQVGKTVLAVPASKLVKAAATEICYLLPKYQATFSVRRIPSSWVYLIFQSAIIHSSFIEDSDASLDNSEEEDVIGARNTSESRRRHDESESERLFRQCIRNLDQMALIWRGASHHVATLRRVAESCRITRPSTPVLGPAALIDLPSTAGLAPLTPHLLGTPAASGTGAIAAWGSNTHLSEPMNSVDTVPNLDWSSFWSRMPSSSEDVWLWQQFIDSFGNSIS